MLGRISSFGKVIHVNHAVIRQTSRAFAQPVSRKKNRDQSENSNLEYYFEEEVQKMLKAMEASVQSLIPLNENFSVTFTNPEQLVVQTQRGKYTIHPDHTRQILVMQSYISGFHNYYFDPVDKVWLSVKDNHDLRGLFTRDLMRHCAGCPSFA
eukprot:gene3418-3747_t